MAWHGSYSSPRFTTQATLSWEVQATQGITEGLAIYHEMHFVTKYTVSVLLFGHTLKAFHVSTSIAIVLSTFLIP